MKTRTTTLVGTARCAVRARKAGATIPAALPPGTAQRAVPAGQIRTLLKISLAALLVLLPVVARAQSLWRDDVSKPMFADKRGTGVGDILTIVVQENTTANKNNETKTEKKSSLDGGHFLVPLSRISGARRFDAGGQLQFRPEA